MVNFHVSRLVFKVRIAAWSWTSLISQYFNVIICQVYILEHILLLPYFSCIVHRPGWHHGEIVFTLNRYYMRRRKICIVCVKSNLNDEKWTTFGPILKTAVILQVLFTIANLNLQYLKISVSKQKEYTIIKSRNQRNPNLFYSGKLTLEIIAVFSGSVIAEICTCQKWQKLLD